jgi:hypothetical protein
MITAIKRAAGFEGGEALNSLLLQAGLALQHKEIMEALQNCLEENLLPSEIILRVIGKQSRTLPPELSRRLAANLFALYEILGKEVDATAKQELIEHTAKLQAQANDLQQKIKTPTTDSQKNASLQIQEALETLTLVSVEIETVTVTRRYHFSTKHTLQHLQACLEGASAVLLER